MIAASELAIGDPVVYRPYDGAKGEDGVVARFSADPSQVFVKYAGGHPDASAKLTPVHRLERP